MPYAIFSQDKPDALQLRNETRPKHREFLATQSDLLLMAGPIIDDAGSGGIGSLTVLNTEDRVIARNFAEADPYFRVGLYESVVIRRWKQTIRDGERISS
ncbi:MAG: hypothetical protein CFH10_00771 [Alphaproteobacteria bacterium MarineAlpha4_Bin2]|nr:MAG: hypothetical protein CFH10_00771 [Alphaproteobacteria bacterium MarineAlpha4_Bin2]